MSAEIIPFKPRQNPPQDELTVLQRLQQIADNLGIDVEATLRGTASKDRAK